MRLEEIIVVDHKVAQCKFRGAGAANPDLAGHRPLDDMRDIAGHCQGKGRLSGTRRTGDYNKFSFCYLKRDVPQSREAAIGETKAQVPDGNRWKHAGRAVWLQPCGDNIALGPFAQSLESHLAAIVCLLPVAGAIPRILATPAFCKMTAALYGNNPPRQAPEANATAPKPNATEVGPKG